MMEIQHVAVKIMAKTGPVIHWPDVIPVFHRWIQNRALPEMLIDVADYSHVPAGPGVMLIGHEAFYSLDNRNHQPGLVYNRRSSFAGVFSDQLRYAFESARAAALLLASEPEFQGKLAFDDRDCEVFVNDRGVAPNTQDTFAAIGPELVRFFSDKWDHPKIDVQWDSAPRGLFRIRIQAQPSE
jgi:hypothetical protein